MQNTCKKSTSIFWFPVQDIKIPDIFYKTKNLLTMSWASVIAHKDLLDLIIWMWTAPSCKLSWMHRYYPCKIPVPWSNILLWTYRYILFSSFCFVLLFFCNSYRSMICKLGKTGGLMCRLDLIVRDIRKILQYDNVYQTIVFVKFHSQKNYLCKVCAKSHICSLFILLE